MGSFRLLAVLLVLAAAAHAEDLSLDGDISDYLATQPRLPEEPLLASSAFGGMTGWFAGRLSGWYPKLEGTAMSQGEMVDFNDELGFNDNEVAPMGRLDFRFLGVGLRLDAYHVEYSGVGQINRTFTFEGVTSWITPLGAAVELGPQHGSGAEPGSFTRTSSLFPPVSGGI